MRRGFSLLSLGFLAIVDSFYGWEVFHAADFGWQQPAVLDAALIELGTVETITTQQAFHVVLSKEAAAQ
ncbi:hypothetical protein D3C78_1718600 [compost metagenome]